MFLVHADPAFLLLLQWFTSLMLKSCPQSALVAEEVDSALEVEVVHLRGETILLCLLVCC